MALKLKKPRKNKFPRHKKQSQTKTYAKVYFRLIFSHPDCTVGLGIAPNHAIRLAGYNCRWGISPRPEDAVLI